MTSSAARTQQSPVENFILNISIADPAKLLRIPMSFSRNRITLGLLDTGSGISIINSKTFEQINDEKTAVLLPLENIKISTASGDPMSIEGKAELSFKLSAIDEMKHSFYVVKELTEDIILGLDFMQQNGITYKGNERSMSFVKNGQIREHLIANIRVQDGFADEKIGATIKPNIGLPPGRNRNEMNALIVKYDHLFAKSMKELGKAPGITHEIHNFAIPKRSPIFRTPHALRPVLKEHIDAMLEKGVIRPSKSSFAAPIMLIPKKAKGEFRCIIDFRNLNEVCTTEFSRVPRIDETIDSLNKSITRQSIYSAATIK